MTTPLDVRGLWVGKTVAVLASGPSLSAATVAELAQYPCIAVGFSFLLAPDVAMLVALDTNPTLWTAASHFRGMKVTGQPRDSLDGMHTGSMFERVVLGVCDEVDLQNSGLAAIRIAAAAGAARIILAGFDPGQPGYFAGHPDTRNRAPHPAVSHGLAKVVAELRAAGVHVSYFGTSEPAGASAADAAAEHAVAEAAAQAKKKPARPRKSRAKVRAS